MQQNLIQKSDLLQEKALKFLGKTEDEILTTRGRLSPNRNFDESAFDRRQ